MTNSIDTSKVEKLNSLKEQQAQLEKEIANQEKLAQNDQKKLEAIRYAKTSLDNEIQLLEQKNIATHNFIEQFKKINADIQINAVTTKRVKTPIAYVYDKNGKEIKWEGEPIARSINLTQISYKGYHINIERVYTGRYSRNLTWKMSLDYSVTNTMKQYTRVKTVIEKIDNKVAETIQKNFKAANLKKAKKYATAFLKATCPKSATIEINDTGRHIGHGRHSYWAPYTEVKITFANGNQILYKLRYDQNNIFKLNLITFKDTRLDDIKSDPEQLINHLK